VHHGKKLFCNLVYSLSHFQYSPSITTDTQNFQKNMKEIFKNKQNKKIEKNREESPEKKFLSNFSCVELSFNLSSQESHSHQSTRVLST